MSHRVGSIGAVFLTHYHRITRLDSPISHSPAGYPSAGAKDNSVSSGETK
jgi:hypothetical protein